MATVEVSFADFRKKYPARNMRISPANCDELKQMKPEDGMRNLEVCMPTEDHGFECVNEPPMCREEAEKNRFLWVVRSDDVPVALELCAWGRSLQTGKIKHSNLTGGQPAHSGGELWFVCEKGVLVNADSGRYGAESPEELAAFVESLRLTGFRVASMGFDLDNPLMPNTVQVGPVEWQEPNE